MPQPCNIHRSLTFDRLHFYHGGVYGDHLMVQWQDILSEATRDVCALVNSQ